MSLTRHESSPIFPGISLRVKRRVAHHRSYAGEGRWGYWSEPHVVISPRGTRLLFASDWGNGSSVDTYVVELPGYSR